MSTATRPVEVERWDCTSEEYHRDTSLSQSKLKHFLEDPEDFHERDVIHSVDRPATKSFQQFGLDAERLMFYGTSVGEVIPLEVLSQAKLEDGKIQYRKSGAQWREFKARMQAEHGEDVELLKPEEWDKRVPPVLICRDKVRAHDRANKLIFGEGEPHVSLRWVDPIINLPCKCQLDMLHGPVGDPRVIVDYKTAAKCGADEFRKSIGNFGYHYQAWWYQRAVRFLTGKTLPFVFVVSKSSPSYHCETYDLSTKWFKLAERDLLQALTGIKEAFDTDSWTSETHGRIVTLEPMSWNR